MTATTCGWCGTLASMEWRGERSLVYLKARDEVVGVEAPFSCAHCKHLSIGFMFYSLQGVLSERKPEGELWWETHNDEILWTPQSVAGKDFPDVPEHIAAAADEAFRCRSIGAHRAAIMLARSVVEATAKDHGIEKGTLVSKIDEMAAKTIVRAYTAEAAHELRHLGNDMAHGDFTQPLEPVDSDAVLFVMASILEEVYEGPARSAAMKARRTGGAAV